MSSTSSPTKLVYELICFQGHEYLELVVQIGNNVADTYRAQYIADVSERTRAWM